VAQGFLLLEAEVRHAVAGIRVAEGGEDPPAHPKVRMTHVSDLHGLGQVQGDAAKVFRCHGSIEAGHVSERVAEAVFLFSIP
jgi:hypothetical protein